MIRRGIIAGLAAAALGAVLVLIEGTDIAHAVLLVVLAVAAALAWSALTTFDLPWPNPPAEDRPGGRKDVSELSWAAFTRDGRVTERVLRRVRLIAARRLAAHGVVWDGRLGDDLAGWGHDDRDAAAHRARASELLGPDVLAALSTARSAAPRALDTWLHAIDQLVEPPAHDSTSAHTRSPR